VSSSLVLVDVLIEDKKTSEPISDLQLDDFLLRDNGRPVSLSAFDRGKDQKLRPIQIWFALMCNAFYHDVLLGTKWQGAALLAGKMTLLKPALLQLRAGDTVGVARWCGDQGSLVLYPTEDRDKPSLAMETIADAKPVSVPDIYGELGRRRILQMINELARTASSPPLPAVILVSGDEHGRPPQNGKTASSALLEFSSIFYSPEEGQATQQIGDTSRYAILQGQYAGQLARIIDLLHNRYQLGFLPAGPDQKLHRVEVALTRSARDRYPNALLRYRNVYDPAATRYSFDHPGHNVSLAQLDSRMQFAVTASENLDGVPFEVSSSPAGPDSVPLNLKLAPASLSWTALPNGDRRSVIGVVAVNLSEKGHLAVLAIKDLEIIQEAARIEELKDRPITISINAAPAKEKGRIRVLVRDVGSGRIGTHDL